jgi:hypothetical protein
MIRVSPLCPSRVRELVELVDGKVVWLPRINKPKFTNRFAGKPVGVDTTKNGYEIVRIDRFKVGLSRVIWLLTYGEWPRHMIDHIDGDKLNNSIFNLRDVPQSINCMNTALKSNNTSGHVGVQRVKNGWSAGISIAHKAYYLGVFLNIEDAIAVRKRAQVEFGFSPRHGEPR